jgi:hypothetical protein
MFIIRFSPPDVKLRAQLLLLSTIKTKIKIKEI